MEQQWIRVVFRRRLLIISLILVQLAFILFVIAGTHFMSRYVNFFLMASSIVVCIYILNKKEKPAYKLTWMFLILLFPLFGGPVYVFFHMQSSPRKLKRQMAEADRRYRPLFLPASGNVMPELAAGHRECLPQVYYLQEYAGFPVYKHTLTTYFDSGESFFAQALEELEKAEHYIFLEFFILRQGKMLDPILDILEKKARQGLDVRFIYDDLGCFMSLPPNFKQILER
ncbi:MAG: PLDc N-terminal domain-containing protein, partial [Treponema sp.]|nr:PLDc N-terminal domain-containing protein [Treponema sp.]